MNNQKLATELGITRQAVSKSLKNIVPKFFDAFMHKYETSYYETMISIVQFILDENDVKAFYDYLRDDQKEGIKKDERIRI